MMMESSQYVTRLILYKAKPILLAYGCPFANDSVSLARNSTSTFGGIGESKGSLFASTIAGFVSDIAKCSVPFTSAGSKIV